MKHHRISLGYAVLLSAVLLAVNPSIQAAKSRARPAQKEHAAKTAPATRQEDFEKHVDQQIASLKEDVYTRATWTKLQEVKREADENAGRMKLVTFSGAGAGFILGCVVMGLVAKRMGRSEENLKIT